MRDTRSPSTGVRVRRRGDERRRARTRVHRALMRLHCARSRATLMAGRARRGALSRRVRSVRTQCARGESQCAAERVHPPATRRQWRSGESNERGELSKWSSDGNQRGFEWRHCGSTKSDARLLPTQRATRPETMRGRPRTQRDDVEALWSEPLHLLDGAVALCADLDTSRDGGESKVGQAETWRAVHGSHRAVHEPSRVAVQSTHLSHEPFDAAVQPTRLVRKPSGVAHVSRPGAVGHSRAGCEHESRGTESAGEAV